MDHARTRRLFEQSRLARTRRWVQRHGRTARTGRRLLGVAGPRPGPSNRGEQSGTSRGRRHRHRSGDWLACGNLRQPVRHRGIDPIHFCDIDHAAIRTGDDSWTYHGPCCRAMEAAAQLLDACLKGNLDKWCVTWQHRGERTGGNRLPRSRTANQQHAAEKRIDRAEDQCRLRPPIQRSQRTGIRGVGVVRFVAVVQRGPLVASIPAQHTRQPAHSRRESAAPAYALPVSIVRPSRVTKRLAAGGAVRLARGVAVGAFEETETVTPVAPSPHLQAPATMTNGVRGVRVCTVILNVDGSDWSRLVKLAFTPRGGHSAHRSGRGAGGHRLPSAMTGISPNVRKVSSLPRPRSSESQCRWALACSWPAPFGFGVHAACSDPGQIRVR